MELQEINLENQEFIEFFKLVNDHNQPTDKLGQISEENDNNLGSKTEMAKVDNSIRLLSLEKVSSNLAQAKLTDKRQK